MLGAWLYLSTTVDDLSYDYAIRWTTHVDKQTTELPDGQICLNVDLYLPVLSIILVATQLFMTMKTKFYH